MIFAEHASLEEKLRILSDAAKYDVACTSSGVSRKGKDGPSIRSAVRSGTERSSAVVPWMTKVRQWPPFTRWPPCVTAVSP